MTQDKQSIIENAVNVAIAFGIGVCSNVRAELADAGYHYNTEAEDYAIEYWASMHPPHDRWKED